MTPVLEKVPAFDKQTGVDRIFGFGSLDSRSAYEGCRRGTRGFSGVAVPGGARFPGNFAIRSCSLRNDTGQVRSDLLANPGSRQQASAAGGTELSRTPRPSGGGTPDAVHSNMRKSILLVQDTKDDDRLLTPALRLTWRSETRMPLRHGSGIALSPANQRCVARPDSESRTHHRRPRRQSGYHGRSLAGGDQLPDAGQESAGIKYPLEPTHFH